MCDKEAVATIFTL